MKYRIKSGVFKSGGDAELIAARLLEISNRGELTPQAVVADAKAKNSPLHPVFEWDNGKAGAKWRLHQARNLLRSVEVIRPVMESREIQVTPVFVHTGDSGYQQADLVVKREDLFAKAMTEAQARVSQARQAAEALEDLAKRQEGEAPERLARITLAIRAMETASAALH